METNTELLNRIEAHIKGRLAVAESRAASSELYEGKKIAYNSILGVIKSLRADCDAAEKARPVPSDVQAAAEKAALSYDMGTEGVAYQDGYIDGMLAERERMMKYAPVAEVREMRGSTETGDPFILTLAFRRIPNIEYHGGKVRVIIEEIKD